MTIKNFGNPVVHFEMPYEDKSRIASFYEKAFGWKMKILGPEMGEYVVAHTTETDENNMVKTPGTINGGFFKKTQDPQSGGQIPSVVIAVDDIKEAARLITEAGGKVIGGRTGNGEPDEIPGIGLWSAFLDSEGNRVSVLQP